MKKSNSVIHNFLLMSVFVLAFVCACNDTYQLEPIVATYPVADSDITSTSAELTGQILLLGTQRITEYGIELYKTSLLTNPIDNKSFNDSATLATFTAVFTGLTPGTKYYYWAYALVNTARVHSQNVPSFTTKTAR
jgi:hypothetical protein